MLADFENRGLAILRLCIARFGQDIDREPRRTVVYGAYRHYTSIVSFAGNGQVPHRYWLNYRDRRSWRSLSATIHPPILVQPSSPRVKRISARTSWCCPCRTPKVCYRLEDSRQMLRDPRQANARDKQVLPGLAGSLIACSKASPFHSSHRFMLTDVRKAVKRYTS